MLPFERVSRAKLRSCVEGWYPEIPCFCSRSPADNWASVSNKEQAHPQPVDVLNPRNLDEIGDIVDLFFMDTEYKSRSVRVQMMTVSGCKG